MIINEKHNALANLNKSISTTRADESTMISSDVNTTRVKKRKIVTLGQMGAGKCNL
jgi:hypothetical protein